MTTEYAIYSEILERVPHITRANFTDDGLGGYRVHVVSHSVQSPRQVVREIVSLLRMSGWRDIKSDNVTVVQIQEGDEPRANWSRLQIAGFAVTYATSGYTAQCRLQHGSLSYEGEASSPSSHMAVAMAALAAVNEALGPHSGLHLIEAAQMTISGVMLSLALVTDVEGDVAAGIAVQRESTAEETMIRAVLDAINRRFVLFSGQKV